MQTSTKICVRGYSDVLVGVENAKMTTCKGRGRGWSAVRGQEAQQARAMQGRAGQGGDGTPFRRIISLPSSTDEDVVDAGGVVFKNTSESCCEPSHL